MTTAVLLRRVRLGLVATASLVLIGALCVRSPQGKITRPAPPPTTSVEPSAATPASFAEAFSLARREVQKLTPADRELEVNRGVHFFAFNPVQELSARFLDGAAKFSVAEEDWSVGLRLHSLAGEVVTTRPKPRAEGVRVDFDHANGVTEWFVNHDGSFEHGLTLKRPPQRDAPGPLHAILAVEGAVAGPHPDSAGDLIFSDAQRGAPLLAYSKLVVFDATGRILPARMTGLGETIEIVVDDAGATYPVTIDPNLTVQRTKVAASDAAANDEFGTVIDLSGTSAIVGAPRDDGPGGADVGSAYVFTISGTSVTQQAKLTVAGLAAESRLGGAVAISGDTALVGAPGSDGVRGSAHVFTRSGATWTLRTSLAPSDRAAGVPVQFGSALDLDGTTAVIGAPTWEVLLDGFPYPVGQAYVFTGSGSTWTQQAILQRSSLLPTFDAFDLFGSSVAVSGNTALIGVSGDTTARGTQSGSAFVFNRNVSTWSEQTTLVPPSSGSFQGFGTAVALIGDQAVVGSPSSNGSASGSGAVYTFLRTGTSWGSAVTVTGSDSAANDRFGDSLFYDGTSLIVGAPNADPGFTSNAGSAYLFDRIGSTWSATGKLTASDAAADDNFGSAVATSSTFALVAAEREDPSGISNAGSLYLFNAPGPPSLSVLPTARTFGPTPVGTPVIQSITLQNNGDAAFSISLPALPPGLVTEVAPTTTLAPGGSTVWQIRFPATTATSFSATVLISASELVGPRSVTRSLDLSGSALSFTVDSDGDGLSDAGEFLLADFGFNLNVSQPALVGRLGQAGLFTQAQLQALKPGTPLIGRGSDGKVRLTLDWKRSTNLATFSDFPAAASGLSVNPQGDIVYEFTPADNAAFFRLEID